tara:strand:- start:3593 stop:3769 length:177 start_codon:yes stop_codon:yes gene_type:complete
MYISPLLVTALVATSTARAFDIAEGAHSAATHTKRTVGTIMNWVNGMIGRNSNTCPAV